MKSLEAALNIMAVAIFLPIFIGWFGALVAASYGGETGGWPWLGISFLAAAWIVGKIADRKKKDTV